MTTKTQIKLMITDENQRGKINSWVYNNVTGNNNFAKENTYKNYVSLEKNYWVLDGQFSFSTDTILYDAQYKKEYFAVVSNTTSDENGEFLPNRIPQIGAGTYTKTTARKISIDYGINYINWLEGIDSNFICNGNRAKSLKIILYDENNNIILEKNFIEDDNNLKSPIGVYDFEAEYTFDRMMIYFYSVFLPYRSLKINGIYFGEVKFYQDNIVSANLLEQFDYLGTTLPIGTLEFNVYSSEKEFNILNFNGLYRDLHINQLAHLVEIKNDNIYDYGLYFLKKWENVDENITKFYCENAVGTLDTLNMFHYTNETVNSLNHNIWFFKQDFPKTTAIKIGDGLSFNNIRDLVQNKYKYLLNFSAREILQKLAFGLVGYIILCNAEKIDLIEIPNQLQSNKDIFEIENIVVEADKYLKKTKFKKVKLTNYLPRISDEDYSLLYEKELNVGDYTVDLGKPYQVRIENASLTSSNLQIIEFHVNQAGIVQIYGKPIIENVYIQNKENLDVEDNDVEEIVINNYLVGYQNNDFTEDLVNYISNYYNDDRVEFTFSTFELNEPPKALTRFVEVRNENEKIMEGNIIKIETDLTGGFLHNITIEGKISENE